MSDRGEEMRAAFQQIIAAADRLRDDDLSRAVVRLWEAFNASAHDADAIVIPALQRTSSGRRALARVTGQPPPPRCREDR
jgi:hypothetical protein